MLMLMPGIGGFGGPFGGGFGTPMGRLSLGASSMIGSYMIGGALLNSVTMSNMMGVSMGMLGAPLMSPPCTSAFSSSVRKTKALGSFKKFS